MVCFRAKSAVLLATVMVSVAAFAFEAVPKASAKCLGVTRGKPFSAGLVFVNGKYIEPPYTVERWGTGIRINSRPVTGQVVDWTDFLKTQDESRIEKKAAAPRPVAAETPPPPVQQTSTQSDADALDDLFDDEDESGSSSKKEVQSSVSYSRPAVSAQPPKAEPVYVLKGDFVKNDASKALVKRINEQRTEIDGILRRGGFIFFGDGYSRVTGDSRTADAMLAKLPEIMQHSQDVHSFRQAIRSARMVYLNEILSAQLYDNRVDYRSLKERRQKIKKDKEWQAILNEASKRVL
ncbi:MAG: hypothetical protein J6W10_05105 [Kiritimatiellae bacterium]|nr:hypothetical protein [Kiritimatiellia bacterium]MBO7206972.1 hypothetical protein [Kiritimatiellia bacterium]